MEINCGIKSWLKKPNLSTKVATEERKNLLKLKDALFSEEIKTLHNKFIVVPIDKASGNVAFVLQRHYAQVLINEFGLNHVNNINSTSTKAIKPVDKNVSENTLFVKHFT